VASLARNAECYSSVANIRRHQLGSAPAERTSETLTGGEAISTIASTLRRITACAVAIDRSTHLIQCGVARQGGGDTRPTRGWPRRGTYSLTRTEDAISPSAPYFLKSYSRAPIDSSPMLSTTYPFRACKRHRLRLPFLCEWRANGIEIQTPCLIDKIGSAIIVRLFCNLLEAYAAVDLPCSR